MKIYFKRCRSPSFVVNQSTKWLEDLPSTPFFRSFGILFCYFIAYLFYSSLIPYFVLCFFFLFFSLLSGNVRGCLRFTDFTLIYPDFMIMFRSIFLCYNYLMMTIHLISSHISFGYRYVCLSFYKNNKMLFIFFFLFGCFP